MLSAKTGASLNALPLFAGLSDAEKETLCKGGRPRAVAKDALLFSHGDGVTHFYIITGGVFQLFRAAPDGSEKTIALAATGHMLCEDEILDGCKGHRASAIAVEEASVMEFPVAWLKESARAHGTFALNLLSQIAGRSHQAELEAEHQASMSAPQLVACFLQRLCVLHDFNPASFDLPYSKSLIASRLGMEAETFSRTLGKLKENGIEVQGNHVCITDLARVETYVCNFCSIAGECATHQSLQKKMPN